MSYIFLVSLFCIIGLFLNEFFHNYRNKAVYDALYVINNTSNLRHLLAYLPEYHILVYKHISTWKLEDFIKLAEKRKREFHND
jgi:hypothetical protein